MAEEEKKTELHFVNKPSQISPHEFLQFGLINTVYHLLVNNNRGGEGRGGGGLKEREGLNA